MRDYKLFLKDILSAIESIEKFVEGMELNEFIKDDLISSAVIRKFEIIGEASKNIPQTIKEKYPEIPWKSMAGMRDTLIHAYFRIDYILVWDTVKNLLPEIKLKIPIIITEEGF